MSQSSHPTLFFSALMVAGLALIPGLSLRAQGEYLDALGGDPYQNFIQQEGIPNYTDVYIKNVWTLPVAPWARTGVLGAYINLANAKMPTNAYVMEIPPGQSTKPEKHMYEEIMQVGYGSGYTLIWNEGRPKQRVDWKRGSVISPPLNVWHQHFNDSDEAARFLAVTDMRPILMLHRNLDFVFNSSFTFTNRYDSEEDFFKKSEFSPPRLTIRNLVPSIYDYQLSKWDVRGKGSSNMQFLMGSNERMKTHLSEMPVGTYKLAHKHGAGAHLYIVSGQGYSLLWPKGRLDKRIRLDWQAGSLIGVISSYFHQHFNSGPEPARYQGLRLGGTWSFQDSGEVREEGSEGRSGMLQIEIEDEDPLIRRIFEETLRKTGVQSRMPPLKK